MEERKESLKQSIIEMVKKIDDIWILSLILRSIKCITI